MVELTRESRKVLKSIYDLYLSRRKDGLSKGAAVRFSAEDAERIEGFEDAKMELKNVGFVKIFIYGDFDLTDKAIIFMENFTKDTILKWLEFGAQFIP